MAVGGAHHGDLDALAAHSGDAAGPFAFDGHAAFERKAELGEELNGGIDVFHHDADVVHTLDCQECLLRVRSNCSLRGWHNALGILRLGPARAPLI
jgi:hypothetical protein